LSVFGAGSIVNYLAERRKRRRAGKKKARVAVMISRVLVLRSGAEAEWVNSWVEKSIIFMVVKNCN